VSAPDEQATATALAAAIRSGDLQELRRRLLEQPQVATRRFNGRTALHMVTDWPGYYPNGPATDLNVATNPDTRRDMLSTWLREQGAQTSSHPG
jgi:hypothetical protein